MADEDKETKESEDTEGHGKFFHHSEGEADTEGQRAVRDRAIDEDDTEGHAKK